MTANEIRNYINNAMADNSTRAITEEVIRDTLNQMIQYLSDYNPAWNNRGNFVLGTQYYLHDFVTSGGSAYLCILQGANIPLNNITSWQLIAAAGNVQSNPTTNVIPRKSAAGNFVDSSMSEADYNTIAIQTNNAQLRIFRNEAVWTGELINNLASKSVSYIDFGDSTAIANFVSYFTVEIHGNYQSYPAQDGITASFNCHFSSGALSSIDKKVIETGSNFFSNVMALGNLQVLNNRLVIPVYANTNGNRFSVKVTANIVKGWVDSPVTNVLRNLTITPWVADSTIFQKNIASIPQDLVFHPNGTAVVFDLIRPFPFKYAVLYNNGVTIVSQPGATVAANTSAPLSLTGTAGKTLTVTITPNT